MKRARVTLRDLAVATGVSITTVSNAFNRPDQLSDELRIAEVCQARQAGLLMLPSVPYEAGVDGRLPAALDVAAVDGFLMYCLPDDDPAIARIVERDRPIVAIDMSADPRFAGVNIDDRGGARLAVDRVLERGSVRPAVLALPVDAARDAVGTTGADRAALERAPFPVTRERWAGYVEALASAGVRVADVPVAIVRANLRRDGELAARQVLAGRGRRPDALLAMTDVLALGALDACRALGLRVPSDVAVIGFDDLLPAAADAGLTTIRQDVGAKARAAVDALFAAPDAGPVVLPVELVVRDSA